MSNVEVKVVRVPGAVKDVVLETGATVNDALAAAGVSLDSNESVVVNGQATSGTAPISDGSRILVAKGAKGN